MKSIIIAILLLWAKVSFAEIYSEDSERHTDVILCWHSEPYTYQRDIYLSRNSLGEEIGIEELVDKLLLMDLESKKQSYEWKPPSDLHPFEGTAYGMRVQEYLTSSIAKMAECLVNNYKEGFTIRYFDNTDIRPSRQKGYVVLNNNRIAVRVITEAFYVD